ncbi:MAG: hypothetical protein SGJ27_26355 [Candidatus Melainabacteria bacterium]|mgnify:CR=1 FL=1|nr:hypothetical protein [Candidatus Melainabacteria bacterium]
MTELAENTKSTGTGKPGADAKPPGDKIDPHVSQQQLGGKNGSTPELTDSTTAPAPPAGGAIDAHVSLQQLGQPDALKFLKETLKPFDFAAFSKVNALAGMELVGLPAQPADLPRGESAKLKPGEVLKLGEQPKPGESPQPGAALKPGETPKPGEAPKPGLSLKPGENKPADAAKPAPAAPPETPRLTEKELEKIAEAIDNAANSGFMFGSGTDKDAINEQLKRVKDSRDKTQLDEIYKKRVGHDIEAELNDELSGSDLQKSLALWKSTNIDAARTSVALTEHKEWGIGARSNATVERDLRDTFSTLNSKQIEEADKAFQAGNNGLTLRDAIANDTKLPESTKKALAIYLDGTDKRTTQNTLDLADLALKERNLDMFQEALRDASPEARKAFSDAHGNQRILHTFGDKITSRGGVTSYFDNGDCKQARDYVSKGSLELDTKIALNTGIVNDNEVAIELAISGISDEQRQSYTRGRSEKDKPKEELTPHGASDREYYSKVHTALVKAGNEREVKKWEDLIEYKDGSLVKEVTKHGGMIDDDIGDVLATIENMSEQNWKRLKGSADELKRLQETLAIDLSESEMERANKLLKAKLEPADFLASTQAQRSITESMKDSIGFFNTTETGVLDAIAKMTRDEQRRYREEPEFKKQVDKVVVHGMDTGLEQKSAFAMLDSITRGGKPEDDVLSKLYVHADHVDTDETKVIEDLDQAFKKDPTLRARLETDKEFRAKFDEAIHKALDPDEYERYAKPLIETGRLPFAVKAELYKGVFNDAENALYEAVSKGSEADFAEVIANPAGVLPFLSEEERGVAVKIAEQKGEFRAEDKIRAAMLGAGTTEAVIHEAFRDLNQKQIDHVRAEYLRKYDSDMLGDTLAETGGTDREKVVDKAGAQPQTGREFFNATRDKAYNSVDGIGRAFVDNIDGTAAMTMDELNKYATGMSSHARRFEEMPLEQRLEFKSNLLKAKELYSKSENSAADLVVDAAIIGAGVLGSKFTGGVSLSLLAYTSFGGALFKIGAKSAIVGNEYDFASTNVLADGASGAIDAVSILMGPTQAANFLRLGEKSAQTAATTVIAQSKNVLEATGTQILKQGSEEALEKRLFQEVAYAISNGAEGVDEKVFAKIAQEFAASPAEVVRVQALVQESLSNAVAMEGANALKAQMRELGLNSMAGNVGGGSSGFVYGLASLDESRSIKDNFYQLSQSTAVGSLTGTTMAAGFTAGLRMVGRGLKTHPRADAPHARASIDQPVVHNPEGGHPPAQGADDPGRIVRTGTIETTGTTDGDANLTPRVDVLERHTTFSSDQIIGDHDSKGKLWWPERHFDQLNSDDRDILFQHLQGRMSPLSEPEFTFDFTEKALPGFQSWTENFAPKFKSMKEQETFVLDNKERFYRLQEQVEILRYKEQRQILNEHFKDDHDNLTFINQWLDARDQNANMHWELKDALEPRRKQLEDLANSVVANYKNQNGSLAGIPEIKVELVAADKMGSAVATYGDGVLRINQAELLNNKSVADLLGTVYHELTHNEQQSTIIRALADQLKVGATISDTDMIPLKQLYKERTGSNVSDDYMRRVIGLRNGVELPPEAVSRANDLMEAFKNNKPVGEEWKKLGNEFRVLQRDLKKLNGNDEPSIAYRILSNLTQTRDRQGQAMRMFGTTEIPPELTEYLKKYAKHWNGDDDAWNHQTELAARKVFAKIFEDRMAGINNRRRDLYENYMQFHEYDAWLSGERARRSAIANGASFRDPKNSLWEEIDWLQ